MLEIEAWTNDRISAQLGILHRVPRDEWFDRPTDGVGRHGGLLPSAARRRALLDIGSRRLVRLANSWRPRSPSRCISARASSPKSATSKRGCRCGSTTQTSARRVTTSGSRGGSTPRATTPIRTPRHSSLRASCSRQGQTASSTRACATPAANASPASGRASSAECAWPRITSTAGAEPRRRASVSSYCSIARRGRSVRVAGQRSARIVLSRWRPLQRRIRGGLRVRPRSAGLFDRWLGE